MEWQRVNSASEEFEDIDFCIAHLTLEQVEGFNLVAEVSMNFDFGEGVHLFQDVG